MSLTVYDEKVKLGNDQEKAQSERDSNEFARKNVTFERETT